ncbi:MAG: uroporphyrinogen decarboxylase family protein [Clostridia bacterium]|nr:uroporphyrinogen decarboxylase family protein [Clostridia bacterium]
MINMKQWLGQQMTATPRKALPILSFPSIDLTGAAVRQLVTDSAIQAAGMAAVAQRCDAAAAVSVMDLSVEAECFGAEILFEEGEVPTVVGSLVNTMEEAQGLPAPRVGDARSGVFVEAVRIACETITDRPVLAGAIGPYSLASRLMDVTQAMVNCYVEPEMVHTVLDKVTVFLTDYIGAFKAVGAAGVILAEPAAGLLTPELCQEFSSDYVRRIVEAVQDDDFVVVYHNCGGAIDRLVPEILSTGAAAYHFGNAVEITAMLEQMPNDLLVMGNVDPVGVLRNGTPELVRENTLAIMNNATKYANFLISSGCDIPPGTPWDNLDAFFAAVAEFYSH